MENRKECHPVLRAVVVNRRMENMEQFLRVGVISSTHGIRGEVKVYPTTDDPERFLDLDEVILDTGREHKILEIEGVKFFKNQVILKFKGYDNINDIEKYLKKDLLVDREHAVELGENENFIADLIDMEVVTDEGIDQVFSLQIFITVNQEILLLGADGGYYLAGCSVSKKPKET